MRHLAVVIGVLALAGCGSDPPSRDEAPARHFAPVAEAPVPTQTQRAARPRGRYLLAYLHRRAQLRASPGGRVLHTLRTRTEFGSRRVLHVLEERGRWLRVLATERPNGRSGWIPASGVNLGATDYSVVVDRSARRVRVRHGARTLRAFPVAVGRPSNPTPLGRFAVTDRLRTADRSSPYGCCALALTGHQTKLDPGWPGGDRLAIHGTPQRDSIGKAVSLGCMRGEARHLKVLLRTLPLGTPVFIKA